jgi:defect-in-organelle-trafficking protein DotB
MTACESGEGGQGARITCRSIKEDIPSISDVGLTPSEVNDLFPLSGATFICGVTGSGKNTTMAAAIAYLIANGTEPRVVIELAAPIEYSYRATQLAYPERVTHIIQQELHRDFSSWSQGIKSSLRSGPDGIIISELRDYETIDQALVAAGTGHHLLGTLHSATPVETFNRLLKVFPEDQKPRVLSELVAVIRVLMNQRLWPAVGGGVLAVRAWFKLTHEIKSNLSGLKPEEYTAALLRHYIDQGKTFSDNAERLYQLSEITLETRDRIIADERSELEKSK